jgi:hypothetical protein
VANVLASLQNHGLHAGILTLFSHPQLKSADGIHAAQPFAFLADGLRFDAAAVAMNPFCNVDDSAARAPDKPLALFFGGELTYARSSDRSANAGRKDMKR